MNEQLLEIAEYCKNEVEKDCKRTDRYGYEILYAAIFDDSSIKVSATPHILREASHCLLIHKWMQLAVTQYYDTYRVQHITSDGEVLEGMLDDEYSLSIYASSFNHSARICLKRNGDEVFWKALMYNTRIEKMIPFTWGLYLKCKSECKTFLESKLMGTLAKKEDSIKSLEESLANSSLKEQILQDEICAYKNLLSDIQAYFEKTK